MGFTIKYLLHCVDGISDDDDFGYILFTACVMGRFGHEQFLFSFSFIF